MSWLVLVGCTDGNLLDGPADAVGPGESRLDSGVISDLDSGVISDLDSGLISDSYLFATRIATSAAVAVDTVFDGTSQDVLCVNADNPTDRKILIVADGRYFPSYGASLAWTQIQVDGVGVGNQSLIDWARSANVQQHTFNNIAAVDLQPGSHSICLTLSKSDVFSVVIGASSTLSVLESSAEQIVSSSLASDSSVFQFDIGLTHEVELGIPNPPVPPIAPIFALPIDLTGPSAFLLSARAYHAGDITLPSPDNHMGDALIGVSFDDQVPTPGIASWSNNDLFNGAELHAPMFSHALYSGASTVHATAVASKFPWYFGIENPVHYIVGAGATMVGIQQPRILGGSFSGSALQASTPSAQEYYCVGSSTSFAGCPTAGTQTVIASAVVTISPDHDGVLMVLAKSRAQADLGDNGTAILGISIDGVNRGSIGAQGLTNNSQRTLSASYLAHGENRLAPGSHVIQVWVQAYGTFNHLAALLDLPLLFFD